MVLNILSYDTSILNPVLKLVILVLFAIASWYFYRCYLVYGGKLKMIAWLLLLGGFAGILASAFRFWGDFLVQWKWGESVLFLILAVITFAVAYLVRMKFIEVTRLFGPDEGDTKI